MDKVVYHVTMSLDGFIAGPDHAMAWVFEAAEGAVLRNELIRELHAELGAVLGGRAWWDVARERYDGVDGIYGGTWSGPVVVLTHRPDEPTGDERVRFVSGSPEEALAAAREAAGGKNVEVFGASVAGQLLEAGLVDEVVVHVAPVLLGDGVRLYGTPPGPPITLERLNGEPFADLRYAPRR